MSAVRGGGVCPVRTFCGQGGSGLLQMRTSALFGAKIFFEIYGVSARTRVREIDPVRTFCGQGEGQFFAILYGRVLWTALNQNFFRNYYFSTSNH